ncbi:GtrA family protein [Rhodopseudomonas palustris]|uniref:GtrA family protein n=1 Tax=Rhodopseudomonas palustris TaxID=1076 RepID=UPI0021F35DC0|nr:GtrA family protein [Rhodopseudomonas palustris]
MTSEFLRFILAGGTAAAANVATRWLLSFLTPFEVAVFVAYLVGMAVAFLLTKYFVFVPSERPASSEARRFVLVNLVALLQVWAVSVGLAEWLFPTIEFTWHAELVAHSIGVASPIVTSYVAHKNFTFGDSWRNNVR